MQRVVWLQSCSCYCSFAVRGAFVKVGVRRHLGVCPLTCPRPQWMLGSVKHLLKCSSWACSLSLSSLTFCLWLTSSWQMKDGNDSCYRTETFRAKPHHLQTGVTKWEHWRWKMKVHTSAKHKEAGTHCTVADTYPHSERELLCSSGQIVILCFKSFTLTVKNLPLCTPFCTERNTQQKTQMRGDYTIHT